MLESEFKRRKFKKLLTGKLDGVLFIVLDPAIAE
jgi:hypothetical protein